VALDKMLKERGLKLDAVIELKVDGSVLHKRIANRIAQTVARGEALRSDDDPEVLKRRIEAYREQTAPLVDYYRWQGSLRSVDGMASIDEVAAAVDRALAAGPGPAKKAARRAASKPRKSAAKPAKPASGPKSTAGKGRSGKVTAKAKSGRKAARKMPGRSQVRGRVPGKAGKRAKRASKR
jgi:adenylate kinase